jgi:hypothetical protein
MIFQFETAGPLDPSIQQKMRTYFQDFLLGNGFSVSTDNENV